MTRLVPNQPEIAVIQTGAANTASVMAAIARQGVAARLTTDPEDVIRAAGVVLPGVGAFGPGMQMLLSSGLDGPLVERIQSDRPTLCVCLGMQLLARTSEESPGVRGLGVIETSVERFDSDLVQVPQLGWNAVAADSACELLRSGAYYFANSFRLTAQPPGWRAARGEYGGAFTAALERGNVLACQFHPELSGMLGASVIGAWLARVAEVAAC